MRSENFLDDVVTLLERCILFSLLLSVFGALVSSKQNLLADGRSVRDVATDRTGSLVFESLELSFSCALETEGHKANAEAPNVVFLGRAIELHGEEVFVSVHELHEEGFLRHAFFVDETKVSVVEECDNLVTGSSAFREDLCDFDCFLFGSGVTRRVVREVEEHDLLVGLACSKGSLQSFRVKATVLEGVESLDLCATGIFEHEFVVVPVEVRDNHFVASVEEHVTGAADGMRQSGRHNRVTEVLGSKRRVFLDDLGLPFLAEVRITEARSIEEGLLREIEGLENAVQNERRAVIFESCTDCRIDVGALGFGTLAENTLTREENGLALFREHIKNAATVCRKFSVQRLSERIVVHSQCPVLKFPRGNLEKLQAPRKIKRTSKKRFVTNRFHYILQGL